ncbi:uncharacterized protein LOC124447078 [Xenia sp. Carnegie-2017]|uniref:uncharacterized protein LOC124447078 n=1 Tax=Xenia sp. Carnegie-2017 TaxID=2897299 RepID=UPI001F043032|nr:uncharacterized protein LOC124447078 [Xenia sp. Carnegie-2017]
MQKTSTALISNQPKLNTLKQGFVMIAKTREIDIANVLSYSLGTYPLSLATTSGSLVKTTKSKLFEIFEGDHLTCKFNGEHCDNNALIVDAMALIQTMKSKWKTFGEFCDAIFNNVLKLAKDWKATRVDFVADRYLPTSIKESERNRRSENTGIQKIRVFDKNQHVPKQWKKFLALGENKESLIQFLCEHWGNYVSSCLGHLSSLYVTSKDKCYCITRARSDEDKVECNEMYELECNHEEADTRLLLHANHAKETNERIIIKSQDTDVLCCRSPCNELLTKKYAS